MDSTGEAWGWRAYWPAISWSGIFAGWLFAWAFAVLLYLFGAAIGITSLAAMTDLSQGVGFGTGAWIVTSWILAIFSGAWLAARLAGRPNQAVGAMHGMVVWALCWVATLLIGTTQATGVNAGVQADQGLAQAGRAINLSLSRESEGPIMVQPEAEGSVPLAAEEPESTATNEDARAIRQALLRFDEGDLDKMRSQIAQGRTQDARELLSEYTDLTGGQVDQVIANLSALDEPGSSQIEPSEDPAARWAGGALWALFLASVFGLAAGLAGGAFGARRSEEFYASLTASAIPSPQEYIHAQEEEPAERW
jgi:hypothetical protein